MRYYLIRRWNFPVSIDGTIIDIETSNVNPEKGEIITFGYFTGNTIKIFQRTDPSERGRDIFNRFIRSALQTLPRPFHAYNCSFEERWLGVRFSHDLMAKWREKSDKGKQKLKWPKVSELISLSHSYYKLEVEATGKEIPGLWERYRKTGDRNLLFKIIYHNLYDLIREACLILWDETTADVYAELLKRGISKKRFLE